MDQPRLSPADPTPLHTDPSPGANPSTGLAGFFDLREPIREHDLLMGYSKSICVLRAAAAEALLAGGLLIAVVQREGYDKVIAEQEVRFLKALESLRSALA